MESTKTFFRAMVVIEDDENTKADLVIANRCETEQNAWNVLDRFLEVVKPTSEYAIVDNWVEEVKIIRKRACLD